MINLLDVSYVRLGTRDLEGATRFAVDYLGLEISEHAKAAACFKSDAREHTLCYFEGNPADQAVAFEVRDKEDLDAPASELERLGHAVRSGTESEAAAPHVKGFIAFKDPSGNSIELVYRTAHSGKCYHGSRDAGITGFSHVGLCSSGVTRDEQFWTQACN